jgi:hypothetical protein
MSGFFQTAARTGPAHAVLVTNPAGSAPTVAILHRIGITAGVLADPYTTMAEIARQPQGCNIVVLSLQSLFREELAIIATLKSRFPHLQVWVTHAEGRIATLAEATRLGADAILTEEGAHPLGAAAAPAVPAQPVTPPPPTPVQQQPAAAPITAPPPPKTSATAATVRTFARVPPATPPLRNEPTYAEPVLSADELRALLREEDQNEGAL